MLFLKVTKLEEGGLLIQAEQDKPMDVMWLVRMGLLDPGKDNWDTAVMVPVAPRHAVAPTPPAPAAPVAKAKVVLPPVSVQDAQFLQVYEAASSDRDGAKTLGISRETFKRRREVLGLGPKGIGPGHPRPPEPEEPEAPPEAPPAESVATDAPAPAVPAHCDKDERCPFNKGGKRHYHKSKEWWAAQDKRMQFARSQRQLEKAKKGIDASAPKAQPSESDSPGFGSPSTKGESGRTGTSSTPSPAPNAARSGSTTASRPTSSPAASADASSSSDPVGHVVSPFESTEQRDWKDIEYRTPLDEPLGANEAVLSFHRQYDAKKQLHKMVAFLPAKDGQRTGKVVLVDRASINTIGEGEAWRVRLEHFPTYCVAFPVKRVFRAEDPTPEPEPKAPKPMRPTDLPKPVSTPPKPPAPKKFDPNVCPCERRLVMLGGGAKGHRPADQAHHDAWARATQANAKAATSEVAG